MRNTAIKHGFVRVLLGKKKTQKGVLGVVNIAIVRYKIRVKEKRRV
jgi:hypothetical protein